MRVFELENDSIVLKTSHDFRGCDFVWYDNPVDHFDLEAIDHNYTYVIWSGKQDIWISCWDQYSNRNVFVLTPDKIIEKYEDDMEYTDFANGEKRCDKVYTI